MGLAPEKPIFPTVILCPFCSQNTLYLFDDVSTENIWLCCQTCGAHGDIITFGAKLWNISLPDTLEKFSQHEVISPETVAAFSAEYGKILAKHNAAEDFYEEAHSRLWCHGHDGISRRLLRLGVRNELASQIDFVGVAEPDAAIALCRALGKPVPAFLRQSVALVVLPFYDLPKRLTGFLFWQYDEQHETGSYFIPIDGSKKKRPEAGYFMLSHTIWSPPGPMKKTQIITTDLRWALRTQCQRLRRGEVPLPIMVAYSGPEAESYGKTLNTFLPAEKIFTQPTTTPELISRACNAGGYVATIRFDEIFADDPSAELRAAGAARKIAKTWQTALQTHLEHVDETAAQAFIGRMTVPVEKLALFFKKVSHHLPQDTVDRALANLQAIGGRTIPRNERNYAIIERDHSWWSKSGVEVCNAQPIIQQIFQNDCGEKIYAGQIFFKGTAYNFVESARKIEIMGLLAYAASALAPHGCVVIYHPLWNKRSHLIAQHLHMPELINVTTQTGWDEVAGVFRFGNYEITRSGTVQIGPAWPDVKHVLNFPEITPIAPVSIYPLLTPAHENSFIWATFATIAANLIAPIFNKPYIAAAVEPESFEIAERVGTVLGCESTRSADTIRRGSKQVMATLTAQASWPVVVHNIFDDNYFCNTAPKFAQTAVTTKMPFTGIAAAQSYGWVGLLGATAPAPEYAVLNYVLPAYIQAILADRAPQFLNDISWPQAVLTHLHQWLQNIYDQTFNLPHALTKITPPAAAHESVMHVINTAVQTEELVLLPQPRKSKQRRNYILRQKETWWLNRRAIDRYFFNQCRLMPNWFGIVDLLKQNGIYCRAKTIYDMPGLAVDTEWADMFLTTKEVFAKETG